MMSEYVGPLITLSQIDAFLRKEACVVLAEIHDAASEFRVVIVIYGERCVHLEHAFEHNCLCGIDLRIEWRKAKLRHRLRGWWRRQWPHEATGLWSVIHTDCKVYEA